MKTNRRAFMALFGPTLLALGLSPTAIFEELPDDVFTVIPHNPSDADKARLLTDLLNYLMDAHFENVMLAIQDKMIYSPKLIQWEEEKP